MKKIVKILSVAIAVLLIVVPFTTTASAGGVVDDALWFLLEWTVDNASYVLDDDRTAQEIVDYASTPNGAAFIALATAMGSGVGNLNNPVVGLDGQVYKRNPVRIMSDVAGNIGTARAGEYQAARVSQDFVNRATAALNGLYANGNAEIRNMSLDDLGLTTYASINANWGSYKSITQSGGNGLYPFLKYNNSSYLEFFPGEIKSSTISIFNGDGNYPPVICVPSDNLLYQNDIALPTGSYIVLNSDELYRVHYIFDSFFVGYWTGSTASDVNVFYQHALWNTESGQIYSHGVGKYANSDVAGYDVLDKLVKSVGIVLDVGDYTAPEPFTAPDITPFADDDGYVICLCPCDNPGQVVYMDDDTFNNYVNDGTIVNDNTINGNIVDDKTIENFGTIINNYNTNVTSSYDDTNLINKLSGWFSDIKSKLDTLITLNGISAITDVIDTFLDLFGSDDSDDSLNLDFDSLIKTKLPIIMEVYNLISELKNQNSPLVIEGPNPLNVLLKDKSDVEDYGTWSIDFSWFDTQLDTGQSPREYCREGLKYVFYGIALVSCYRRVSRLIDGGF